jgi:hypothetical protein
VHKSFGDLEVLTRLAKMNACFGSGIRVACSRRMSGLSRIASVRTGRSIGHFGLEPGIRCTFDNTLKKLNGAVFTVPSKFRLVTSAMGRGTTVAVSSLYFERRGSVLKSNHIAYSGGAMMPVCDVIRP